MKKHEFLWMAVVCTLLLTGCKSGGEALLLEAAASEEDSGAAAFGESGSETEKSDTVLPACMRWKMGAGSAMS
jgi:hypothetical protein